MYIPVNPTLTIYTKVGCTGIFITGAVLTSTHSLCFKAKIRKNMYTPVNPTFTIYTKVGCTGVFITRAWYPDVLFFH